MQQPYLHLSRHLHAMRRPRGCGGRFLNTKKADEGKDGSNSKTMGVGQLCQSTGSQNSDVLQSDSSISPREVIHIRSNLSGSEVTSMFSMGDLNNFPNNNMQASPLSLSSMMNTGHGIVMPSKWIAAADICPNLKVWRLRWGWCQFVGTKSHQFCDQVTGTVAFSPTFGCRGKSSLASALKLSLRLIITLIIGSVRDAKKTLNAVL